jgi:hypothetical protein
MISKKAFDKIEHEVILKLVFCTGKNTAVKIVHSSSEMVLQTTKHNMIVSVFLHWQDERWSRSCVPVLRWSCELQSTLRSILV